MIVGNAARERVIARAKMKPTLLDQTVFTQGGKLSEDSSITATDSDVKLRRDKKEVKGF